jgi:hypothetical protein
VNLLIGVGTGVLEDDAAVIQVERAPRASQMICRRRIFGCSNGSSTSGICDPVKPHRGGVHIVVLKGTGRIGAQ